MKVFLKIFFALLLIMVASATVYIYNSGPDLPEETDLIIDNVMSNPLPEIINGETGVAHNADVNIWYECISPIDSSRGTVLLIMGIANDALGWPPAFIKSFVDSGYQVIRYDHRGTGLSDWSSPEEYSLSDMADDAVSILDDLEIPYANIVGVSMGGMIAQEVAIKHSERVHSLTSIMSSGNIIDPDLSPISADVAFELIKVALKYGIISTQRNLIKLHIASRIILQGNTQRSISIQEIAEHVLYNIQNRKGYNAHVSAQHQTAVSKSASRYMALSEIQIPTLIVHGVADPFIPIEHGRKCAQLIPRSDSLWVENMGHDIPDEEIQKIVNRAISIFN